MGASGRPGAFFFGVIMYGILKSSTNTGKGDELVATFAAPTQIISRVPVLSADTLTLKRDTFARPVQRWEIISNISASNDIREYFLNAVLAGSASIIYLRPPQLVDLNRVLPNGLNITHVGVVAAGSTAIILTGFAGKQLPKGELINIGDDPKVYMVRERIAVNGAEQTYSIFPALRLAAINAAPIRYGDTTVLRARYDTNTVSGISYSDGILADPGSITFIEAL